MTTVLDQDSAGRLTEAGKRYRSCITVVARQLERDHEWTTEAGSELSGGAGDWLLTSDGDSWTIIDDLFQRTYEQLPDGTWRKSDIIRAVQVEEQVTVRSPEGDSTARVGDWLVSSEVAGTWPVSDTEFTKRYVVVSESTSEPESDRAERSGQE